MGRQKAPSDLAAVTPEDQLAELRYQLRKAEERIWQLQHCLEAAQAGANQAAQGQDQAARMLGQLVRAGELVLCALVDRDVAAWPSLCTVGPGLQRALQAARHWMRRAGVEPGDLPAEPEPAVINEGSDGSELFLTEPD